MSPEQKLLFKNYDTCAYYCHSCHERNANCTCLCPNIPNPGVSSFTLVNNHSRLLIGFAQWPSLLPIQLSSSYPFHLNTRHTHQGMEASLSWVQWPVKAPSPCRRTADQTNACRDLVAYRSSILHRSTTRHSFIWAIQLVCLPLSPSSLWDWRRCLVKNRVPSAWSNGSTSTSARTLLRPSAILPYSQFVTFAYDICSYTAQSLCESFEL